MYLRITSMCNYAKIYGKKYFFIITTVTYVTPENVQRSQRLLLGVPLFILCRYRPPVMVTVGRESICVIKVAWQLVCVKCCNRSVANLYAAAISVHLTTSQDCNLE